MNKVKIIFSRGWNRSFWHIRPFLHSVERNKKRSAAFAVVGGYVTLRRYSLKWNGIELLIVSPTNAIPAVFTYSSNTNVSTLSLGNLTQSSDLADNSQVGESEENLMHSGKLFQGLILMSTFDYYIDYGRCAKLARKISNVGINKRIST